jgi:hypothetical protein
MPKADATELAPKKIGYNPPAWRRCAGGVIFPPTASRFSFPDRTRSPKSINPKAPFSLVKLPSGGLGLQNAQIARLLLPGALFGVLTA